ncbi:helix-turn-helix transcriptional regulator [Escherichia sp. E2748]|uniref:helix-turn-helix domain-containing protein n=1 Tax=Escherichia sp. E2748 TaxID=2044460 RepID=UPI001F0D108E|nr:helix-turn-helix transcriptional regulator [Escherichia sp. E2748]
MKRGLPHKSDNSHIEAKLRVSIMIGKRLKIARINAGLTQTELGVRAGLDEESASSRISSYENEVHSPDFGLARKFAAVLDIPEAYFYAVDDDLATVILQYHQYRKNHAGSIVFVKPQ